MINLLMEKVSKKSKVAFGNERGQNFKFDLF